MSNKRLYVDMDGTWEGPRIDVRTSENRNHKIMMEELGIDRQPTASMNDYISNLHNKGIIAVQPDPGILMTMFGSDEPIGHYSFERYKKEMEKAITPDQAISAVCNFASELNKEQSGYDDISPKGGLDITVLPVHTIAFERVEELQGKTMFSGMAFNEIEEAIFNKLQELNIEPRGLQDFVRQYDNCTEYAQYTDRAKLDQYYNEQEVPFDPPDPFGRDDGIPEMKADVRELAREASDYVANLENQEKYQRYQVYLRTDSASKQRADVKAAQPPNVPLSPSANNTEIEKEAKGKIRELFTKRLQKNKKGSVALSNKQEKPRRTSSQEQEVE